ncbi:MAG: hypothetical protein AAFR17_08585 [Pseudomonadota bacterium]
MKPDGTQQVTLTTDDEKIMAALAADSRIALVTRRSETIRVLFLNAEDFSILDQTEFDAPARR